jgi:hypothetical protein
MLDRPRLSTAVILAMLAGCMTEASRYSDAAGLKTLIQFFALVLFLASAVKGLDWLWWLIVARFKQVREAMALTEKVKVIQAISLLNDAQIRLLESGTGVIEVMAGAPNPSYVLRVGGATVPFDFIEQFLNLDDGAYLCPVSTWTEGSKRREWAQLLTNHLVLMGYAELHNGNKAARWVNRQAALAWIGLDRKGS